MNPSVGAERSTYLAFDLGASSGRAMLGTLAGERMELREVHRFETPLVERGSHLYWDVEALWREVRDGLEAALREEPNLRGVSVDSWAVDYVPLDRELRPLRDAYAYRDPRTRGRMATAFDSVPAEELYRRTGIQLLEINTLYQLLADLEEEPEVLERTAVRLLIADYLHLRLSGRAVVERTNASTTQLMDIATGEWAMDLIRRFGLPTSGWPQIVAPGTVVGPLLDGPSGAAPPVIASCSHDTAAAVAAIPAEQEGPQWAYLSSGTWSLLGVERTASIVSEAARVANFTNEAGLDGTVRFLKNLTGLWVLQECEREWREGGHPVDPASLMAEAAASAAPEALVDLNDAIFSERGGMVARLLAYCREHRVPEPRSRGETVRLILESLASGYADALTEMERVTGERIEVLHVVGGGSRNSLLCQATADACGRRVVAGPAEATALGNLLIQARTLGELPAGRSIREVVRASVELREYLPASAKGAVGDGPDRIQSHQLQK
jgi:rhamnulokinase